MNFRQVTICAAAALWQPPQDAAHTPRPATFRFEMPQVARPAIPSNTVSVADFGGSATAIRSTPRLSPTPSPPWPPGEASCGRSRRRLVHRAYRAERQYRTAPRTERRHRFQRRQDALSACRDHVRGSQHAALPVADLGAGREKRGHHGPRRDRRATAMRGAP